MDKKKQNGLAPELQRDLELGQKETEALAAARAAELRERDRKLAEDKEREQNKELKAKRNRKILILVGIVLLILMLLVQCSQQGRLTLPGQEEGTIVDVEKGDTINIDDVKKPIATEVFDPRYSEQIISMNKVPVFENGLAEGKVNIKNDKENVYNQMVNIYIVKDKIVSEDSLSTEYIIGDLIYTSPLVEIGKILETAKLDVNLPSGEYSCIAEFLALEVDTNVFVGSSNAVITVTIKNTAP